MTFMIGGRKARGFTLIELIISTALFMLAATALGQIFSSFFTLHRKVSNQAAVSQEMRFALEFLVRQARQKAIDYPAPPAASAFTNSIDLVDQNGNIITIGTQVGSVCQAVAGVTCLAMTTDGGITWYPITGSRTSVTHFTVVVRPLVDPFEPLPGGGYDNDTQPMVTFALGLSYLGQNPNDTVTLDAQTSVAQRRYLR